MIREGASSSEFHFGILLRCPLEDFQNEPSSLLSHVLMQVIEMIAYVIDIVTSFAIILSLEWRNTTEEDVGQYTNAPDVCGSGYEAILDQLGSYQRRNIKRLVSLSF